MMSNFFHNCMTGILVLFYSLVALAPSCQAATNLALGKSYTMSPLPEYPWSAPPTDTTSLTDGKYTTDYFWTQKTTVGWHPVTSVEILIDLEKVGVIEGITFNTARGDFAGVFYPLQIHVFVGPDKEHFTYFGDMAEQPKNIPGPYQVTKFEFGGINAKGRFVLLEIIASNRSGVFCDEIEVLEGQVDSGVVGNLDVITVRNILDFLKWDSVEQKLLRTFLEQPVRAFNGTFNLIAQVQGAGQSAKKMAAPTDTDKIPGLDSTAGEAVNGLYLSVRADALRKKFPQDKLLVESIDPWGIHTPFNPVSGQPLDRVSLSIPVGGYDNAAFLVTNITQETQTIQVSLTAPSGNFAALSLFQAPFVRSSSEEYVPDPLAPASEIVLLPGESRVMFIAAQGNAPGVLNCLLNIEGQVVFPPVPVTVTVPNITLPDKLALNAVNWGYLSFSLVQDRIKQAVDDLQKHHTDVVVVPPSHLQGANQLRTATLEDFNILETYLKHHQSTAKVLLGIGFGTVDRKTVSGIVPFLSDEWKDNFKKWYADAVLAAGRAGFTESQLYLYPYDEMGGEQLDDFIAFATWVKNAIPETKLYATIMHSESLKVLPYLDIVQILDGDELLSGINTTTPEVWIYDTEFPSRSLSPYSYYRLMCWKAFFKGYTGVGFWAYADIGEDTTAWKELARDFAVIYDGDNQSIISSRRWEAWRMGIEDYELLKMYAVKKGIGAAKAMAGSVLDHPADISKADQVRQTILTELSHQ